MSEEFRPEDTISYRLRTGARDSRAARETIGGGTGISVATVLVWGAGLVGLDLPPEIAVTIGGLITTVISGAIRHQLRK